MKTITRKTKQKKKPTIRDVFKSLNIDLNKKIDIRVLLVEALSLYVLTILITSLVQMLILDVSTDTFRICLLKSAVTNIVTAIVVMLGLNVPTIKGNVFFTALSYTIISIPYADSFIIYAREGIPWPKVLLIYFIVYFVLGFFIQRFLGVLKNLLNRIINNGSRK